jgi:tetratricopeptide (TPR) repeat protein
MNGRTAVTCALAALLVAVFACKNKQPEGVHWLKTMDEGKAAATEEGKPLLVYYSADWNKMSEQFEEETLRNAAVEAKMLSFVAVEIDADVDEETPKLYGVNAFPTTIFYTPAGDEVTRIVGVVAAEEFGKFLDDVLQGKVETLKELLSREEANPDDLPLAYEIASMYIETGRPEKAQPRLKKIIGADPENGTGLVPGALTQLGFIYLVAQRPAEAADEFNAVIEKYPDAPEVPKCILYIGDSYQLLSRPDDAVAAYRSVIEKYPDTPEATEAQTKVGKLTMFEETVEAFTQGPEGEKGGGKK